jgi:single-stranded DNA-binding protein
MISISVSGVLVAKPQVVHVGSSISRKCEFTVFDLRRVRVADAWQPVWERVVFVAWDDEADRVALIMSKGAHVSCTGLQETHQWVDRQGERRLAVKYRLTAWSVNYRQRWSDPSQCTVPLQEVRASLESGEVPDHIPASSQNSPVQARAPNTTSP